MTIDGKIIKIPNDKVNQSLNDFFPPISLSYFSTNTKIPFTIGKQIIALNLSRKENDYISLTDMAKVKGLETGLIISHWLTTKYTIQFIDSERKINSESLIFSNLQGCSLI